jgi:hypothetical protein
MIRKKLEVIFENPHLKQIRPKQYEIHGQIYTNGLEDFSAVDLAAVLVFLTNVCNKMKKREVKFTRKMKLGEENANKIS